MTKRITLALAMLGLSAAAFAGGPGNNMVAPVPAGINLIAPDSTGMWSFGVTGLLMQPGNSFIYATQETAGAPQQTIYNNLGTGNQFDGGVEADVSYLFPGNSRDVTLGYTWLRLNATGNSGALGAGQVLYTPAGINSSEAIGASANGSLNQTLNSADLTFGQLIRIGERVDLHPFMGVRFAAIDSDQFSSSYDPADNRAVDGTIVDSAGAYQSNSDFAGAGPRAGTDATVHLCDGFSVVGTIAGSLLVGNQSATVTAYDQVNGGSNVFNGVSYTSIVPELDAKLGLDYNYAFPNNAVNSLDVQAGYQVVNYFNAVADTDSDTNDNFNYAGPYLRLQLNVA